MAARVIKPLKVALVVMMVALILILFSSTANKSTIPRGTPVPFSEFSQLASTYDQEINARRGEIEISIEIPKTAYTPEEVISFSVSLINRSDKDIVIHKPDAEYNIISAYPGSRDELAFVVIPDNPAISLAFQGPSAPIAGLVHHPEGFALLSPGKSYVTSIAMPRLIRPMPPGRYSVFLTYRNHVFAADEPNQAESFIDYHAWMGEITSNTLSFEIIP